MVWVGWGVWWGLARVGAGVGGRQLRSGGPGGMGERKEWKEGGGGARGVCALCVRGALLVGRRVGGAVGDVLAVGAGGSCGGRAAAAVCSAR